MVLTILRIFILYVLATAAVRIMGKRQIGELQPSELVITILLSEIAAIPMQDTISRCSIPSSRCFCSWRSR